MAVITAPTAPTHELAGARFTAPASPTRGSTDTSVWLVEIDPGTAPRPHEPTREEIFVVLSGSAAVQIGESHQTATVGDTIVVPAGVSFALAPDGGQPLRALCCLPVGGQARLPGEAPFTPPWAA